MSFKRDADDPSMLWNLKKRRVSELLSEDIPDNEARIEKNGRVLCLVCRHKPEFDTVAVLAVHRLGKKHARWQEEWEREQRELEGERQKRAHELHCKHGAGPARQFHSGAGGGNGDTGKQRPLVQTKAYDPRSKKTGRKPTHDWETLANTLVAPKISASNKPQAHKRDQKEAQTISEYVRAQHRIEASEPLMVRPYGSKHYVPRRAPAVTTPQSVVTSSQSVLTSAQSVLTSPQSVLTSPKTVLTKANTITSHSQADCGEELLSPLHDWRTGGGSQVRVCQEQRGVPDQRPISQSGHWGEHHSGHGIDRHAINTSSQLSAQRGLTSNTKQCVSNNKHCASNNKHCASNNKQRASNNNKCIRNASHLNSVVIKETVNNSPETQTMSSKLSRDSSSISTSQKSEPAGPQPDQQTVPAGFRPDQQTAHVLGDPAKAEYQRKYLQAIQSGWRRDRGGQWVRDPDVEFDSDEEPPDL